MKKDKGNIKLRILSIIGLSVVFGALTGLLFAAICARFVPVVFTDWAGSFVCEGKMVFQSLQRSYQCYTSPSKSYELGGVVFDTMFKMFLIPSIGIITTVLMILFTLTDTLNVKIRQLKKAQN